MPLAISWRKNRSAASMAGSRQGMMQRLLDVATDQFIGVATGPQAASPSLDWPM